MRHPARQVDKAATREPFALRLVQLLSYPVIQGSAQHGQVFRRGVRMRGDHRIRWEFDSQHEWTGLGGIAVEHHHLRALREARRRALPFDRCI